jgi:hypothetical protein
MASGSVRDNARRAGQRHYSSWQVTVTGKNENIFVFLTDNKGSNAERCFATDSGTMEANWPSVTVC